MAYDTPAHIGVIGAGPIGIEAALYGRYLGYSVDVFEQKQVANHVRQNGETELAVPFSQCSSTLGIAALQAQDESFAQPDPEAILTRQQWVEKYLRPLSKSDLLLDGIHEHCRVMKVCRLESHKSESEEVAKGFSILVERNGNEQVFEADIVFDVSGNGGEREEEDDRGADNSFQHELRIDQSSTADKDVPQSLVIEAEPNFYILGSKRDAGESGFQFSSGLEQIKRLFTIIGDRETLDLYASARVE